WRRVPAWPGPAWRGTGRGCRRAGTGAGRGRAMWSWMGRLRRCGGGATWDVAGGGWPAGRDRTDCPQQETGWAGGACPGGDAATGRGQRGGPGAVRGPGTAWCWREERGTGPSRTPRGGVHDAYVKRESCSHADEEPYSSWMPVDRRGRWTPATCPHPDLPPQAGKGGGAGLVRGDSPGRDGPAPRDDAVRSPRWAVPGLLQGRPDLGSLQGEVSTRGARKGNPLRACAAPQRPLLPCTRTTSESPHACGPLLGPPFHVEHSQDPFHACGALLGPLRACAAHLGSLPAVGPHPPPPPLPPARRGAPSLAVDAPGGPPPGVGYSPWPPPPAWGGGRGGGHRRADCRPALLPVVPRPDAAAFHLHRELRDRLVGRRAQRAAVAHVEAGPMEHAFHAALHRIDPAGRQLEVLVAAAVLQRVQLAVEVDHHDAGAGHLVEGGFHFARQQFGRGAHVGPGL